MKATDNETPDIPMIKSVKNGIMSIIRNAKNVRRNILPLSILIALVAAATFGGNVGDVKVDYIKYTPYHEISSFYIVKYLVGAIIASLVFILWRATAFAIIVQSDDKEATTKGTRQKVSDTLYTALRILQFCLLALLTFGIIAALLVYMSVKISAWIWIAATVYAIFISVPLYVSLYEYMLADTNFRTALRKGVRTIREQWGRVFLRLALVNFVVGLVVAVVALPATALAMSIYDNATAVTMNGSAATPVYIYIAEYAAIFLAVIAILFFVLIGMSVLRVFYQDIGQISSRIAALREEEAYSPIDFLRK